MDPFSMVTPKTSDKQVSFTQPSTEEYKQEITDSSPNLEEVQELSSPSKKLGELKQKIRDRISNKLLYGDVDFLLQDKEQTSKEFLKQITYNVNLSQLYTIQDTCLINRNIQYCPILVKKMMHLSQKEHKGTLQLQVWNNKGTLIYMRPLFHKPRAWFSYFNALVFMPNDEDLNSDSIFIVYLEKENTTVQVKIPDDLLQQIKNSDIILGFCNQCIYIGIEDKIYILYSRYEQVVHEGEVAILDDFVMGRRLPYSIDLVNLKVHAFSLPSTKKKDQYFLYAAVETLDNQMDFQKILYYPEKREHLLKQIQEVVTKTNKFTFDPVASFKSILVGDSQYGVALRESGYVDFYWNYFRVSSSEEYDKIEHYDNIDVTFDGIYVREKVRKVIKEIKVKWKGRVGIEVGEDGDILQLLPFEKLFQQRIKDYVNFYHTYCLINTSFIVAHSNKIFIYDILKQKWIRSFNCKTQVVKVFRSVAQEGSYQVGILLQNNRFSMLENKDTSSFDPNSWTLSDIANYQVSGTPRQIVNDAEHSSMLYLLTESSENQFELTGFANQRLHKISGPNFPQKLTSSTQVIPLFTGALEKMFVLFTPRVREGMGKMQVIKHSFQKVQRNNGINTEKLRITIKKDYEEFNDSAMYKEVDNDDTTVGIDDEIHSAISENLDEAIIFIGKKNIYVIDVVSGVVKPLLGTNIVGLQLIDKDFCYAITNQKGSDKLCSVSVICIYKVLQNLELFQYSIDSVIGGMNGLLDFSVENQRMAFMKSYEEINIIPPLHRSTINFMGMLNRDRYICSKRIGNKFITLDKINRLTMWNIVTGKFVSQTQLVNQDFSKYEIFSSDVEDLTYRREWNQPRTLIYQTNASVLDEESLDKSTNLSDLGKCDLRESISFLKSLKSSFHEFKYIEIENETKVKEHLTFIYRVSKKYQRIFISDDCQHMVERLFNFKVQIYKRGEEKSGYNTWQVIQRIQNYPFDLSDITNKISYCPYLFSPNLLRFLNFDMKKKLFYISHTITNQRISVPISLMDPIEEDPYQVVRRFKWVTNDSFLITSSWGMEKLIRIEASLINRDQYTVVEVSSAAIPAFSSIKGEDQHMYIDPEQLESKDIETRLSRKQQRMKRVMYIYQAALLDEPTKQAYNTMFDIDYNIQNGKYKFVADKTFSYVHWNMIEKLVKGEIEVSNIDIKNLRLVSLNILPGGQTIFHAIAHLSQQIATLCKRVELSQPQIGFEMPFLMNFKKKTALHLCVQTQNYKTADILLQYLSQAPLDHHSRAIVDILPQLINQSIPSLPMYLESRLKQTPQISTIIRGAIRQYSEDMEDGVIATQFWPDTTAIEAQIFEDDVANKKGERPNECDIKLVYFDLPDYHCFLEQNSQDFFKQLKDTQQMELFSLKSTRILIDYLWPLAKKHTQIKLMYPFIIYLILYWCYTNIVVDLDRTNPETSPYTRAYTISSQILLILFSLYFMINELYQIFYQGIVYLSSPWNYIDMIPPSLIISITSYDLLFPNDDYWWEQTFQAIGSLFMWIKLLYFLRINKRTGYLVRMIVKVIFGMRVFLLVMMITIIAFADAFVSLKAKSDVIEDIQTPFTRFITSCFLTYRMILGDIDFSIFSEEHQLISSILFFFCTIFVMIVMLNLLIAIISETFGDVQQNQINEFYQEKASIISENSYLIPQQAKEELCLRNQYLLIASKVESQQEMINRLMTETGQEQGSNELVTQALIKKLTDSTNLRMDQIDKKIDSFINKVESKMLESQKSLKQTQVVQKVE